MIKAQANKYYGVDKSLRVLSVIFWMWTNLPTVSFLTNAFQVFNDVETDWNNWLEFVHLQVCDAMFCKGRHVWDENSLWVVGMAWMF